jgi:hypothetical protein
MTRVLATINDEQKAWVESQSDSLDVPEAEVIRCVSRLRAGDLRAGVSSFHVEFPQEAPGTSARSKKQSATAPTVSGALHTDCIQLRPVYVAVSNEKFQPQKQCISV